MKHTIRILSIALLFGMAPFAAYNQVSVLSPEEAVQKALEANFDIRISQSEADIARINNTKGNAGMLPVVNFVANESFTVSAFQQKLANGSEFIAAGAPFNSANAGVQLSWTLFDGKRMQIAKRRLEETQKLSELNLQQVVQNTAATVLAAYYDIVRSKMQERSISEIITLNEERLRIAEARLAAGFAAQTDALQARIDLNQRRSDLLAQQTATSAGKRLLNRLLMRPADTAFEVSELTASTYTANFETLREAVLTQNPGLMAAQKSAEISALQVDESRSLNKARITGISQFNALRSDNGAGFALNNTQAGITIGAGLVLPLYNGGNFSRQVQVARTQAEQSLLRVENQRLTIETELQNQLAYFQTQQQILQLEDQNIQDARESLNVSTERFRVGVTTGIEPQSAQNALEQALFRRNLVLYNLKMAELRLKLLAGAL